jgi:hypothetical protein
VSCVGLILGAVLLWILQCSLYQIWWKKGLSASVAFCQETAVEGECAALDEVITNAKYLPLPALHVKFQMGRELVFVNRENSTITDRNYRSDIFSCMPWQQIRRHLEFRCGKRGMYRIEQLELVSYDLLWSSHFFEAVPVDTFLYVYPAFVDERRLELPLKALTGAMTTRSALLKDPFEMQSIRDYTQQDAYRDINWKASARTGSWKVNVHAPAASWKVTLLLDCDADRLWADLDLKEETVRLCATLADQLIARGIPVAVRSNACDCISGGELRLEHGAGKDHIGNVLQTLARAELNSDGHRKMELLIRELLEEKSGKCSGQSADNEEFYILISPCQRESLADIYGTLCGQSSGSQWILPLREGEELRLKIADPELADNFYPWEVAYADAKRFSR